MKNSKIKSPLSNEQKLNAVVKHIKQMGKKNCPVSFKTQLFVLFESADANWYPNTTLY